MPCVDTQAEWKEHGFEEQEVQVIGIRLHVFCGGGPDSQRL